VYLFGAVFFFSSCKKEENKSPDTVLITTKWIEQSKREDILFFNDDFLNLERKKEVNSGGHLIPKIGAGLYNYKTFTDSLELQHSLSSLYAPKKHAYRIENDKLFIADFYEKTDKTLVFVKFK
jgi:hypothetical protein